MRRRRLAGVLGVMVLVLVACGDDDGAVATDDTSTTTSTTEPEESAEPDEDPAEPDDTTTTSTTAPDPDADRPSWTGTYAVDYETGVVDVAEYNAFLGDNGTPSGGVIDAALEMLAEQYVEGEGDEAQDPPAVSSRLADGGRTVVTVVYEGLLDDSVAAVRFELVFIGDADDVVLESGAWASRCQPGRGHQEFSTGLCL